MSVICVLGANEAVQGVVKSAFQHFSPGNYMLRFPAGKEEIMECLNYDLPDVVLLNVSNPLLSVEEIVEDIKNDAWLHNFGIVCLYDKETDNEEEILKKLKEVNVLAVLSYGRMNSHLLKIVQLIEQNRQIIFTKELSGTLVEKSVGSFVIDNDPLAVSVYASIAATMLTHRGVIDGEARIQLQMGLAELILNGIEHGNCGITYEEKTAALTQGKSVAELVAEKCKDPSVAAKKVTLEWEIDSEETIFAITDEGAGFDVQSILGMLKGQADAAFHGRGIKMAAMSTHNVAYNSKGNSATLTVKHQSVLSDHTPQGFSKEEVVNTQPGDIIFREGEPGDFLYYISSGKYSVFHRSKHVGMLSPSDIFMGEMSFLLNNKRSASVRSETKGKLIRISRKAFVSVIKKFPHYGMFLSKLLARKLARANVRSAYIQNR